MKLNFEANEILGLKQSWSQIFIKWIPLDASQAAALSCENRMENVPRVSDLLSLRVVAEGHLDGPLKCINNTGQEMGLTLYLIILI